MSESQGGVTETIQRSGEQLGEAVSQAKDRGKRTLSEQLNTRTNDVGKQARTLAEALRQTGERMQTQGNGGGAATVASGVADRLERAGGYLENARGDELLREAERFARERPWLLAGAAAMAGLVASRFLKASSERRFEATRSSTPGNGRGWQSDRRPGTPEPGRLTATGLPAADELSYAGAEPV